MNDQAPGLGAPHPTPLHPGVPRLPSPVEELDDDRFARYGVRVLLKRDDLISPAIPGNKWRKLKYNLVDASASGTSTILTFGGAFSNHIRATAAAGELLGLTTIGVIRGEEHLPLNWSLSVAAAHGMQLTYLDRSTYRQKHEPDVLADLRTRFGDFFLLPEGGSNPAGVRGCAEILDEVEPHVDVVCCGCGSGGTLAGMAASLRPGQQAIGFSALKGGRFLRDVVGDLQRAAFGRSTDNWRIDCDFHFGGFARRPPDLQRFIDDFAGRHGIGLEPVYVAKMMYGLFDLVRRGTISPGATVLAVVTGPDDHPVPAGHPV
ncbi:1-aminocyclopropane-1-carboxylate deaminase/D-cysteine desulfhydrase [Protofrankia symbiont of Coriaria ruscifolia]|uniref:1-aminocyclopropane-1-carboxylate deaminase/D-cysteine desulfhydrase n=1 Tax=Protofrankia symbiont of Coriaria ruscifolia TaxID=1306542 RepID=UPI0010410B0C|nr:pyridoxal-phosphate dependent enzyme [Protofrankia symbiont of Coriaria ruscifolia]